MLLFGYYLGKNSQWVSDHSNNEAIIRIIFHILLFLYEVLALPGFRLNLLFTEATLPGRSFCDTVIEFYEI